MFQQFRGTHERKTMTSQLWKLIFPLYVADDFIHLLIWGRVFLCRVGELLCAKSVEALAQYINFFPVARWWWRLHFYLTTQTMILVSSTIHVYCCINNAIRGWRPFDDVTLCIWDGIIILKHLKFYGYVVYEFLY